VLDNHPAFFEISFFSTFLPLAASLILFKKVYANQNYLLVFCFFLLQVAAEIVLYIMTEANRNGVIIALIYSILEYLLVIHILRQWIENKDWKYRFLVLILACQIVFIGCFLLGHRGIVLLGLVRTIAPLLIIPCIVYTVSSIAYQFPHKSNRKWKLLILLGLLIYYCGSFAFFAIMLAQKNDFLMIGSFLNALATILSNSIFVYAIFHTLKSTKSSLVTKNKYPAPQSD